MTLGDSVKNIGETDVESDIVPKPQPRGETMQSRRDWFKTAALASAGLAAARIMPARAQQPQGTSPFFPGFRTFRIKTSSATINGVIGGQGPPLLLLHGAP